MVLEGWEINRCAIRSRRSGCWQGTLRVNQLTIVTATLGAKHVISEVGRDHGRGTDEQHQDHLETPHSDLPLSRRRRRHVEDGHRQGLVLLGGVSILIIF